MLSPCSLCVDPGVQVRSPYACRSPSQLDLFQLAAFDQLIEKRPRNGDVVSRWLDSNNDGRFARLMIRQDGFPFAERNHRSVQNLSLAAQQINTNPCAH